jgi:tryptophanyl-tRNA synthetase
MSKSDPDPKATVFLTDTDKQIEKKIKSAVTDSGNEVSYEESKPGVVNLINIQSALTGQSPEQIVERYAGKMYGHLKLDTAEVVIQAVAKVRDEAERLMADRVELDRILRRGAEKARVRASATLSDVYDALGFVARA